MGDKEQSQILVAIADLKNSVIKELKDKVDTLTYRQSDLKVDIASINTKLDIMVTPQLTELHQCVKGNGKEGLESRVGKTEDAISRIGTEVRRHDCDLNDPKDGIKKFVLEKKIGAKYLITAGAAVGSIVSIVASLMLTPLWKLIEHILGIKS